MGCFGYICKGCKTSIRGDCYTGGEKCVMIHVRNGQELGRVEGHYDEYGRVIEQSDLSEEHKFRGDNDGINGHREICDSEFRMKNSYEKVVEKRMYDGEALDFYSYVGTLKNKEVLLHMEDMQNSYLFKYLEDEEQQEFIEKLKQVSTEEEKIRISYRIESRLDTLRYNHKIDLYKNFLNLPEVKLENYSGVVAWHSVCYNNATEEEKANLTPSLQDPNQSWGKVRKKYS